jgi:ribonuclease HI
VPFRTKSVGGIIDDDDVANCFLQGWYRSWERNGWITSQKTPVENRPLWEELLALVRRHQVSFYRVKGHVNLDHPSTNVEKHYRKFCQNNGDFPMEEFRHVIDMNNRADALANEGIDENR